MLAPTQKGNLSALWSRIASEAEPVINEKAHRQGSIEAEISEGSAQWYLVRTFPGDDARALRWLARRRFGVFQPMQQRRIKREIGAQLVQGWEAAFPGWLFVLCWDVEKMRGRINTSPGVMGLLCDPATNKPVPIAEDFIDRLRALAWVYNDRAPHVGHYRTRATRHVARMRPKAKKIDKRTRKTLQRLKNELKAMGKWEPSTWENANTLAPHERIALLQQALKAPSLMASAS